MIRVEEKRNVHRVLAWKPEGKESFEQLVTDGIY